MKVLIIIPTYNECENIISIIFQVLNSGKIFSVLVVDDNSPDNTADIVEKYFINNTKVFVLKRNKRYGLGSAYCEGFQFAIDNNYDFVGQMDADFSHNPDYLISMIELCIKNGMVIGSRYVKNGGINNWPYRRYLLSYFANFYAGIITGIPIKDLTSGFSIIKIKYLRRIKLNKIFSNGFAFQIELKSLLYFTGAKIKEFPIIFDERRSGKSKLDRNHIIEAIFAPFRIVLNSLSKINDQD